MDSTNLLIIVLNGLLIIVIYKSIQKFWEYRLKQKLIKEGFVDENSLASLFRWKKNKDRAELLKLGIFSLVMAIGVFICDQQKLFEQHMITAIAILLFFVALGAFLSFFALSKLFKDDAVLE